ncbi:MAG TPA: hypothetical protein VHP83_04220 [Aggregatilineaceae bacterium]|nr:hypothetical protein [Aggregatilineaceae bacterium]
MQKFSFTKRQLGLLMLLAGLLVVIVMVAAEAVNPAGFGMIQKLGVLLGVLSIFAGLTLLPLGSRPA